MTFEHALKAVYNTPEGKMVIDTLKSLHVYPSAMSETEFKTVYELGKKELVLDLIDIINTQEESN